MKNEFDRNSLLLIVNKNTDEFLFDAFVFLFTKFKLDS